MQGYDSSFGSEMEFGKVREDAKDGDGRKIHGIYNRRADERFQVWLGLEDGAEVENPVPALQNDIRDH